jgi:RHS repeat-associated protein
MKSPHATSRHPLPTWATAALVSTLCLVLPQVAQAQIDTKVRSSSFEYGTVPNVNLGLLIKETVEPTRPNDCLQTSYSYDQWGNKNTVSTSACALAGAETLSGGGDQVRSASTVYTPDGKFPWVSTNALGQQETKTFDPKFGQVTSLRGPNGLDTTWEYDSFGRKTLETRSDQTKTRWYYKLCSDASGAQPVPSCPAAVGSHSIVWVAIEQSLAANNSASAPEKRQYYDSLDRVVRVQTVSYDGVSLGSPIAQVQVQDTLYNYLGQVEKKSDSYYLTSNNPQWTLYTYDALGRVTSQISADPQAAAVAGHSSAGESTARFTYSGLSTTAVNPKGQSKTTIKNAQGQVAISRDHEGKEVRYRYDALGQLVETNAAGVITVLEYNQRGQKTRMDDPAMGQWLYAYNAFGELVTQRDSLQQYSNMRYDKLGRLIERTEPDLKSQWSYDIGFDSLACGLSKGKLCAARTVDGLGATVYLRKHSYDSQGRIASTATTLDKTSTPAVVSVGYDANTGRVARKTWPTGYQASYAYTPLGYLQSVTGSGGGSGKTATYSVRGTNAHGQTTHYAAGNGLVTTKGYDPVSGRLMSTGSYMPYNGNRFSQSYTYDGLSNLTSRADQMTGVSESFSYDNLNRLTDYITVGGGVTPGSANSSVQVMYDARGNITYKSDVGQYWYDPTRPNRVAHVTLSKPATAQRALTGTRALSYAFDEYRPGATPLNGTVVGNGNLMYTVSQDAAQGRHSVRWEEYTSFNMPYKLKFASLVNAAASANPGAVIAATPIYSEGVCPAGFILRGNGVCFDDGEFTTPVTTIINYTCPASYKLSGDKCQYSNNQSVTASNGTSSDRTLTFAYGPEHQRVRQDVELSPNAPAQLQAGAGSTWYLNGEDNLGLSYEKEVKANGTIEHKHYLSIDGMVFALQTVRTQSNGTPIDAPLRYFHHDHLGSVAAITNERGDLVERMAYDPWGKRRNVNGLPDSTDSLVGINTDRGFTMHEQLDEMGVVHMNGRIYDPLIGRFMSADPIIQAPDNLQSYNRYAYVMNNPLAFTDPTGYSRWTRFRDRVLRPVLAIAVAIYFGPAVSGISWSGGGAALVGGNAFASAVVGGFAGGVINTGTLKGGLQGALSAGLFYGVGEIASLGGAGAPGRVLAHAAVGCVSAVAGGGNCGAGALAAGFSEAVGPRIKFESFAANLATRMVIGGTASALGGGKFENGAVTGAFGYLFNELSHYKGTSDERLRMGGYEIKDYIRYEQSTGQMYLIDGLTGKEQFLGQGYAGRGFGFNNPDAQNVSNIGPIPEGLYSVGPIQDNRIRIGLPNERVMQASLRLTPITNIGIRAGFLIHSDFGVTTASNGCICTPLTVREAIANTGVRRLQVVQ